MKLDGTHIEEYNLTVVDRPNIPSPERDVEHIYVRGRSGSLTKKFGFKDIVSPIELNYLEIGKSFKKDFRAFKMILFNAKRLSFEDDMDIYYKIKSVSISEAENEIEEFGKFTVNFTLAPFQYEDNQAQTITERTTINNPAYESEPIITAHCAGTGKLYVNDQEVTIKDINGTIIIDSELMNAYRKADGYITNLNHHMIGDFPVLAHGKNVINFDGAITKIELNPRWRWV